VTAAPHRPLEPRTPKEKFLVELFDTLWVRYRERMEYVRRYEALVESAGGTFVNDHIAFRTFAWQQPAAGIFRISRIIEPLGYRPAACYEFPDKSLSSIHYRHENPRFPKLFITQLKTWELSPSGRSIIGKYMKRHRPPLPDADLAALARVDGLSAAKRRTALKTLIRYFAELPWDLPQKADVLKINEESQFAAWVLVNGYDVNHFTASVDSHGVPALDDIEKTAEAMRAAGIPMKKEIEGARGTRLRQTSTEAVVVPTAVRDGRKPIKMPWSYAYFEIAERPPLRNPETGEMERFEGFLGGQAANLFEMTKVR
jgi:hypothetical protein